MLHQAELAPSLVRFRHLRRQAGVASIEATPRLLFTGATASVRGNPGFAAFASAKAGLRNLAQSMARELGREGIHVAHVVVDGGIDGAFIRGLMGDALAERPPDSILDPDHIAETYWAIHRQKRSAWTFEADVRPWVEHW